MEDFTPIIQQSNYTHLLQKECSIDLDKTELATFLEVDVWAVSILIKSEQIQTRETFRLSLYRLTLVTKYT